LLFALLAVKIRFLDAFHTRAGAAIWLGAAADVCRAES